MEHLSEQQLRFFNDFGFLVFRGVLKDDIEWITDEFESVFTDKGIEHDPTQRTCFVPFIDQREKLSTLLDHPVIVSIAESLMGPDFNYIGGDGNYYTGDTSWHTDGSHDKGLYLKFALYLDPVGRDSGALRVVPGSHRPENWALRDVTRSEQFYGVGAREVPYYALETQPGDLAVFAHNLLHSSWGGSSQRRMFTLNMCDHADTPEKLEELHDFIASFARFWVDLPFGKPMIETAGPARMRHLQQVLDNCAHLPALSAKARATMAEPARG